MRTLSLFLLALFLLPHPSQAQGISVGPQLSLLGIGASGMLRLNPMFSVSGEFGFLPVGEQKFDVDGIEYTLSPTVAGGMLMVNLHPIGTNLSVSAGVLVGGYAADGETEQLSGMINIGGMDYPVENVGTLKGDFTFEGPAPALMVGLRGKGFNIGIGAAFSGSPEFNIEATGELAGNAAFQADLQREVDQAREDVNKVSVMPLVRIGYQFGIGK